MMTATFTSDFHHEFEIERNRWLRRRFLWYTGVVIGLGLLQAIGGALAFVFSDELREGSAPVKFAVILVMALNLAAIAMYFWAFQHARSRLLGRESTLRLVYWLIVATGVMTICTRVVTFETGTPWVSGQNTGITVEPDAPGDADSAPPATPDVPQDAQPSGDAPSEAADASDPPAAADADDGLRVRGSAGFTARQITAIQVISGSLAEIFFAHFFACLFLPWTPRESIRPLIPLLILSAVITIIYLDGWLAIALTIVLSPLIAVPGGLICWWRHSRFRSRFHYRALRGRYSQMKQELTDARRIHEALFPAPITNGSLRFNFVYQPMRQIGGDFLYIHRFPGLAAVDDKASPDVEPLNIVIIDVTGHGIPAALTVNRLHGELERIFAEQPDIEPGDVLTSLNRYVHLTLANHSVYATALCLRIDPAGDALDWASGGHPPAFVRTIDGRLDRLDSTAFVLGACHGADFKAGQQTMRFARGDVLIAYTDGATEARNDRGQMLRVEGLQRIIAGLRPEDASWGGWSGAVLRAVDQHRFGPPADDTLVVEAMRPIL